MKQSSSELKIHELIKVIVNTKMKDVYTAVPAHILAFDPSTQTAQIQIGILRVDVNGKSYAPPPIIECPVCFLGDGFTVEFQIDAGCEGLALFSQRCIDGWLQTGGVADNPLARFHDMSDCLFLAGFRSMPNVITNFQNNGIRIRNKEGNQFAWLKNDGSISVENGAGHIRIASDGTVTINGVVITPSGAVTTPSTITASGEISGNGINLSSHVHGNVQNGSGTTSAPS